MSSIETPVPDRRPNSIALDDLVHRYAESWFRSTLGSGADHLTYVHGFVRPAAHADSEPRLLTELYDAARREAGASKGQRIKALIAADDSARLTAARRILAAAGDPDPSVSVSYTRAGNAEEVLDALESGGGPDGPVLALLDNSSGPMMPYTVLARLGAAAASEVFFTFTPQQLTAVATGEATGTTAQQVFGGSHWEGVFSQLGSMKYTYLISQYRASLAMAGFRHAMSVGMLDEHGSDLQVMFGTNDTAHLKAMKKAMWAVDCVDGVLYRDPRDPNEESVAVRRDPATGPLRRQLLLYLADRPDGMSVEHLRKFTLRETMYRPRHADQEIRSLIDEGLVETAARGRPEGSDTIRLVG